MTANNLILIGNRSAARLREFAVEFFLWIRADRRRLGIVVVGVAILLLYACSRGEEKVHYIYEGGKAFSQERVIENPYKHIADNKIEMVEESEERLRQESREIQRQIGEMRKALEDLRSGMEKTPQVISEHTAPVEASKPKTEPVQENHAEGANPEDPNIQLLNEQLLQGAGAISSQASSKAYRPSTGVVKGEPGPYSITFPVAVKREEKATGVVIPSGSYVKAKIVSGVQVPMGETYPTLLQLDYAFIKPSNRRVDLTGCFVVAKAEGDISTERLQMSPHSMSCYNARGMYFKRDKLVGWASDTRDNDFALRAEVNLNQGRVAQTAFAKALIDGLGASLERNTKSIGGKGIDDFNPDIILKDSGQKVGGMVADFYLSYLKGLRPTMKVTSGRDAWLVFGTDIELPYEYFKKEESDEAKFDFVTDIFH
ncbi:MAG: hypothetical protein AB7G93_13360 [Bdellovibrionales bacterium]